MANRLVSIIRNANTDLLVNGKLDTIPDYFATGYLAHGTKRDLKGGHKTVRALVTDLRKSFPDMQVRVDILLEGDSRVAWQRTIKATHKLAFKGFPATHRKLVWRDMVTSRFDNDLIAEEWVLTDLAEQLLLARKK